MLEIRSQFLFRLPLAPKHAFTRVQEERLLQIEREEQLEILKSKDWLRWEPTAQLRVGDRLLFRAEAVEHPAGATHRVEVSGDIVHQELRREQAVGSISYKADAVHGDAVLAFLRRFCRPVEPAVFFPGGGYIMLAAPDVATAPADNRLYAEASKDLNPIHTSDYFALLARHPGTIVHGMWTSANALRVVQQTIARGLPQRLVSFAAEFTGIVRAKDRLETQLKHVGMKNGRMLVEVRTEGPAGLVLKASAEVLQPTSAFVFTGQGSAGTPPACQSSFQTSNQLRSRGWYGHGPVRVLSRGEEDLGHCGRVFCFPLRSLDPRHCSAESQVREPLAVSFVDLP